MEPTPLHMSTTDQNIPVVSIYHDNNYDAPNFQLRDTLIENSNSSSIGQPVEAMESTQVPSSRREENSTLSTAEISNPEENFENFIQKHGDDVDHAIARFIQQLAEGQRLRIENLGNFHARLIEEWNTIYELQGAFRDLTALIKELSDHLKNSNRIWDDISPQQLGLLAVYAARAGCINILEWILYRGGSLEMQSQSGHTALHYAAETNHFDVVKWLVAHGANVRAKTNEQITVLHYAAFGGNIEIMKFLLEHGARPDLNLQSYPGYTVFHYASFGNHQEMADFLVSVGADTKIKDHEGDTYLRLEKNSE